VEEICGQPRLGADGSQGASRNDSDVPRSAQEANWHAPPCVTGAWQILDEEAKNWFVSDLLLEDGLPRPEFSPRAITSARAVLSEIRPRLRVLNLRGLRGCRMVEIHGTRAQPGQETRLALAFLQTPTAVLALPLEQAVFAAQTDSLREIVVPPEEAIPLAAVFLAATLGTQAGVRRPVQVMTDVALVTAPPLGKELQLRGRIRRASATLQPGAIDVTMQWIDGRRLWSGKVSVPRRSGAFALHDEQVLLEDLPVIEDSVRILDHPILPFRVLGAD
jgi:hypothetical protein